ncbi:MAG: histidine phosphatase family protein [Rhodobacteraceae bacterium]|nr:histidine phosphatase family protein [Paracoccaceae bacterium]
MTASRSPSSPDFLIFIRHGQTDWNAELRLQGQRDIPLNSLGESQAFSNGQRLGAYLNHEGLSPAAFRFVASPLGRTRKTMDLLRAGMGVSDGEYHLEPKLRELTFGDWEGFTTEELKQTSPDLVAARYDDKWGFVPPNGESYAMLSERISQWIETVSEPTIVVAHGGVFRALRGLLENIDTADVPMLDTPQDKVFVWRQGAFTTI